MKQKITEKAMAGVLGVSERTLRNWRSLKIVPYTKIGRVILFDPDAVRGAGHGSGNQA
jgi:hypothetical protein